jgi:mannitol/fructose-specific phosphotransferase system IIA component (Ntr-type)
MIGKISSLLDPSRIQLHLQSTQHTAALEEVAQLLATHPEMISFKGFYRELLARDHLDTTSLGHGIALPHSRTEDVRDIVLAVGRSDAGIPFENGDEPIRLLFMLGIPKTRPGDYLLVVSSLCKLLKSAANREAFMTASTPEDFIKAAVNAEEKILTPA